MRLAMINLIYCTLYRCVLFCIQTKQQLYITLKFSLPLLQSSIFLLCISSAVCCRLLCLVLSVICVLCLWVIFEFSNLCFTCLLGTVLVAFFLFLIHPSSVLSHLKRSSKTNYNLVSRNMAPQSTVVQLFCFFTKFMISDE